MNKLDAAAEMTLELAHGAREPSAADKARNLAALRARLGLVPHGAGAGRVAQRPLELEPMLRPRSLWPRLLVAGVATGVVGFLIGLNLGRTYGERELPVAAGPSGVAAPTGVPAPQQAAPPPASAEAPQAVAVVNESDVVKEVADEAEGRTSALPRNAIDERTARARSEASGPDFLDAVRLLRRAQRALRTGDAAVGSSLLDELDERFRPGVLQEERQATRVLAWCASGEPERAEALARELLAHNPRSIYARRMHQSCVGDALAPVQPAPIAAPRR